MTIDLEPNDFIAVDTGYVFDGSKKNQQTVAQSPVCANVLTDSTCSADDGCGGTAYTGFTLEVNGLKPAG